MQEECGYIQDDHSFMAEDRSYFQKHVFLIKVSEKLYLFSDLNSYLLVPKGIDF